MSLRVSNTFALLVAIAVPLMYGCASAPYGNPTIDVEAAQARTAQIDVKTMTRADVHTLLGEPWLASDAFDVEVYRLQGKQRFANLIYLGGFLLVPFPSSEPLEAYSLVSYGPDGRVSARASDYITDSGRPTIVLRADGYLFVHGTYLLDGPHDTLSASLQHWLDVLAAHPSPNSCTVLVGADLARVSAIGEGGSCECAAKLSVDGTEQSQLHVMGLLINQSDTRIACQTTGGFFHPVWDTDHGSCSLTLHAFAPLTLTAGTHVLRFATRSAFSRHGVESTLHCDAGQPIYATLGGELTGCVNATTSPFIQDPGGPPTVTFSPQSPATDSDARVVIYDNGQWLHPAVAVAR